MKKNVLSVALISLMIVSSLTLLGWQGYKKMKARQSMQQQQKLITSFDQQIIPLLKKKAQVVQKYLISYKYKSKEIDSLLIHIPNWRVKTLKDLNEVEQLSSLLDSKLSEAIVVIDENQYSLKRKLSDRNKTQLALQDLQKIEKEIRTQRTSIGVTL